jgi:hypothetical protein
LLVGWARNRGSAQPQSPPEVGDPSLRIRREGCGAERGGSAPPDASCKVREENFSSGEIRTVMLTAPPETRAPERTPASTFAAAIGSERVLGAGRLERR